MTHKETCWYPAVVGWPIILIILVPAILGLVAVIALLAAAFMWNPWVAGYVVSCLICWPIIFGAYFAHFQRKFPNIAERRYDAHKKEALIWGFAASAMSIVGFVLIFALTGGCPHGFKFK